MKVTILLISLTFLIACHQKSKLQNQNNKPLQSLEKPLSKSSENQELVGVVIKFLKWYKTNYKEINQIDLVDYESSIKDSTKFYSLDFKATEKYLLKMKSSGLLSDKYIKDWQKYFLESQKNFEENPQNDGPPEGFDYDLVLLTQEIDETLSSIENPKIIKVTESEESYIVTLNVFMELSFRLSKVNGKWLIDKIEHYEQK